MTKRKFNSKGNKFQVFESSDGPKKKVLKKITRQRLKNIGLFYLKRFESSMSNLRTVLRRRVTQYARQNPDFDRSQAFEWIEELLADFERWGYLNDSRYAEMKIRDYLNAGKPEKYIKGKLLQKGINQDLLDQILETQEYNPFEMAFNFARKKKIGPFRIDETARLENRQKDMGVLVRAGFDYETVMDVLNADPQSA